MSKNKLAAPTLHLNGSSADGLMNPLQDAAAAINAAIGKLLTCAPHGRDYYVQQDSEALKIATAQHMTAVESTCIENNDPWSFVVAFRRRTGWTLPMAATAWNTLRIGLGFEKPPQP